MPPVQFFHPKDEFPCTFVKGRVPWSRIRHYRRFLETPGQYLTRFDPSGKHEILEGEIQFWGEWEAETDVRRLNHRRTEHGHPRFVHRPIAPTSTPQGEDGPSACRPACGDSNEDNGCGGYLNTDPCVFSDSQSPTPTFLYSNCQQDHFHRVLQHLEPGDVILFGSHDHGSFVLDTVFVVAESYPYSPSDAQTNARIRSIVPDWYYHLTLNLLPLRNQYVLYVGATIDNPVNGMFSFFPCSTSERHPLGFARPATLKQYHPCRQTQGIKSTFRETSKQLWQQAVKDVLDAGLYLGVRANV